VTAGHFRIEFVEYSDLIRDARTRLLYSLVRLTPAGAVAMNRCRLPVPPRTKMHLAKRVAISALVALTASASGCYSGTNPSSKQGSGIDEAAVSGGGYGIPEPGEGVWRGNIISDGETGSREVVGLIDGWGRLRLLTDRAQYVGAISRASDLTTTTIRSAHELVGIAQAGFSWPDGSAVADFSLSGTMSPSKIQASYTGSADSGRIELSFDTSSNRQFSVRKADGLWVLRDEWQNIAATFEITSESIYSGSIYGSDTEGCVYDGRIVRDVMGTSAYLFGVDLTIANCAPVEGRGRNGDYGGHGGLTDNEPGSGNTDLFFIGVNTEAVALNLALEKL
jgi:hypothetical protein